MRFAYLSSNLALMSALAFLFKAGSLNKSLLTLFLSKLISTESNETQKRVFRLRKFQLNAKMLVCKFSSNS